MDDFGLSYILNSGWQYVLTGIGVILLFIISKFALGLLILRFVMKVAVVTVVAYLSIEFTTFLTDILKDYMPINNPILSFACQMGLFDGINLFFKIAFTAWSSKLIIRTVINS